MRVVGAPRGLLAAGASLFLLVPLAVVTAGVFSSHVWWDLPLSRLALTGWVALILVAPVSWRLMMGRRGSLESLATMMALGSLALVLRSIAIRGTLQAVWSLTVMAVSLLLVAWARRELLRPYFDPGMSWYSGIPRPLANIEGRLETSQGPVRVRIARLGVEGVFVFSVAGQPPADLLMEIELGSGDRKVRLAGEVVRQFFHPGAGWGVGLRFRRPHPDRLKEFGDFLNAIRSEGHQV